MGVVNVMLLLPEIGHRRCPPPLKEGFAAALSLIRKTTTTTTFSNGILLTVFLKISFIALLISGTRASGENEIAIQSYSKNNNNLRLINGLATGVAATTQSDIKIQNLDTLKSGSSERVSNNATTKNIRKTPSHIISLRDSSLGRSSSSPNTYNSESEQLHQPTLRIAENQVGPPSKEDEISITNITSQLQTHTYLPCKLSHALLKQKQIGNKSVSWVRVRDDHILTVDRMTFITDDRFQSYYSEANGVWTLQIKYVQARDEGIYECQVSTEPKVSAQVQLNVVVPKTELVGEQIRYVKDGSNAILRCVVRGALESPIYISWFYGSKQIYNDSPRGWKITLERDVLDNEHDGSHSSIGSLIITSVRKRDSGNYTCSPSNSDEVTVMLHVINGEYSASAITSSSSRGRFSDLIVTIIISVVMFKVT